MGESALLPDASEERAIDFDGVDGSGVAGGGGLGDGGRIYFLFSVSVQVEVLQAAVKIISINELRPC